MHRAAMAAVWKHTIQGDPRREDLVQPYKRVPVKEEDQDPDFRALASLGLGMAGLFTKVTRLHSVPIEILLSSSIVFFFFRTRFFFVRVLTLVSRTFSLSRAEPILLVGGTVQRRFRSVLHGTPRSEYEAGHNGTDVFPVRTCELVH